MKLLLMGLGQVGTSLLNLLLKENEFKIDDIFILDKDESVFDKFIKFGGNRNNCIQLFITSSNYLSIFDNVQENDFVVDLVNGVDNLMLANECSKRNIHYLSTCDDCFDDKFNCFTFQNHYDLYKALHEDSKNRATSLVEFGMNPGLVNVFTKKALVDIVETDDGEYVAKNRTHLQDLIAKDNFNLLAKELGVTKFVETDIDITKTNIKEDKNTVYSTWNVPDYDIEIHENSIIKLGTEEKLSDVLNTFNVSEDDIYYLNKNNGTLILDKNSLEMKSDTFSILGKFSGHIVSHEENFSLFDYYTIRDSEGNIDYAPTMYFLYKPCDLALNSVIGHEENNLMKLILKSDMINGGEAVGMVVFGKNFTPRYVGNYLDIKDSFFETPTILQVSIGCLSAIKYIKNHPRQGLLFPEHANVNEIIEYASKYMKIDSIKLTEL